MSKIALLSVKCRGGGVEIYVAFDIGSLPLKLVEALLCINLIHMTFSSIDAD